MYSETDNPCGFGFPIRKSAGQRVLAPNRSLSQRATSFIACVCQGIPQTPLHKRLIAQQYRSMPRNKASARNVFVHRTSNPEMVFCDQSLSVVFWFTRLCEPANPPSQCQTLANRRALRALFEARVLFASVPSIDAGGANRDRTDDLKLAKLALSQLSYGPGIRCDQVVGLGRLELPTSRLSSARSNQLSYKPKHVRAWCPLRRRPVRADSRTKLPTKSGRETKGAADNAIMSKRGLQTAPRERPDRNPKAE